VGIILSILGMNKVDMESNSKVWEALTGISEGLMGMMAVDLVGMREVESMGISEGSMDMMVVDSMGILEDLMDMMGKESMDMVEVDTKDKVEVESMGI
jgi:hypothetical protein